jgi:sporulation protein YlmC with PRC-barrel domain
MRRLKVADDRYGESYGRSRDDRDRYRDDDRGGRGGERGMFGFGSGARGGWQDEDRDDHRSRERGGRFDRDDHQRRDREERGRGGEYREDRDRGYGSDDHNRGLPMDETSHLIASNKVEGTAVYGGDGRRLGSIHNFMVDKLTGRVEYAVMSYSTGFLGMGSRYYPLPWRTLSYDKRVGGYRIDLTERDLRDAPSFDRESEPRFDRNYGSRVHDYYGLKY